MQSVRAMRQRPYKRFAHSRALRNLFNKIARRLKILIFVKLIETINFKSVVNCFD